MQGFANALKWVKEMKEVEEELNEKINYLSGFAAALRDQIHTDILVRPGNGEPSIPAHRALLVCFQNRTILMFSNVVIISDIYSFYSLCV